MAAFCAFRRREEIGQEDYIILWVSAIRPLAINWGRESSMSALAKVPSSDSLFMRSEKLVERSADEFQGEQVIDTAMRKDFDLEFHREAIPRRRCRCKGD